MGIRRTTPHIHLPFIKYRDYSGVTTIFALAKMTTFISRSGYSYINVLVMSTKKVATTFINSDHLLLIHQKYVLPLILFYITPSFKEKREESSSSPHNFLIFYYIIALDKTESSLFYV